MARHEQIIHVDEKLENEIGISRFVRAGNTLYMSGLLSADENFELVGAGDMEAQVARIYARMEHTLAHAGASLKDVVSEISFATDLAALGAAGPVRRACYERAGAALPAATAVQVAGLFLPGAMLEIHPTVELPPGA